MPIKIISLTQIFIFFFGLNCFAASVKQAEFGDQFYPAQKKELSAMIDNFLSVADPEIPQGEVSMLISPHAGYGYSGQVAGFGYKLIKNKSYKTVIILGTSHHKAFNGVSLYASGDFVTSLGKVTVDDDFIKKIINKTLEVFVDESAFSNEHSVEVQLPFLQKVLVDFKIVPVVIGDCSFDSCKKIASLFKEAIGDRKDVLIVVSTDLYHGYDFQEADRFDAFTLGLIRQMDSEGLYYALRDGKAQACGGFGAVIALELAKEMGDKKIELLNHTNSALVTGKKIKGEWAVGYASCAVIDQEGVKMLNIRQRKKLLKIAREAIEVYLKTDKKLSVNEDDPVLNKEMGAFVTLSEGGRLRGCIGNLIGSVPLYLTVRDMAIEAAVGDPRFQQLNLSELKDIEIEISVLSVLERAPSAEMIEMGKHGVLVRHGDRSGVFLPQVAVETGWSKEEFLNNLCAQKAGLAAQAWKDKTTELYIFSAEVFNEKELE